MRKFLRNLRILWHSFFLGMKNADVIITTSQKNTDGSGVEIPDIGGGGGVFKDLLEQKVTQEVEELRYSSYKVANEAKKYRYVGNGQAVKKTDSELTEKHVPIDESDNLNVILIQDNHIIAEDVITSLNEIDKKVGKKLRYDTTLKIKRDFIPRFYIEDYITKAVVKQAEGNYVLDLYCSKYPKQFSSRKDKSFITELKNIRDKGVRSDMMDFEEISFITENAWGVDDWFKFVFTDFELYGIIEYDGNYIIRLGCLSNEFAVNILDKVFSASAEEKYQKKEARKNVSFDFMDTVKEENKIPEGIDLKNLENIKFSLDNEGD